jgi:hypothetical protein
MGLGFNVGDQFNELIRDADTLGRSIRNTIDNAATQQSVKPWDGKNYSELFKPITIEGDRWNKLFPYRLLVVDVTQGNLIVGTGGGSFQSTLSPSTDDPGLDQYRISFQPTQSKWEYRLPITPQQFSVSTPYAISTNPTLRGIVEEHSGTRFKIINCAGSMGVWPSRYNVTSKPKDNSVLTTLFAGTIDAFNDLSNQVNRVVNAVEGNHPAGKPIVKKPEGVMLESTGYYHALLLDQFLEQYSEAKKRPENAGWRLVFDIPKENQSFVVTPVQYSYSKSAESPNEIKYQLQFRAWQRIDLRQKVDAIDPPSLALTTDALRRVISAVEESRRTLASGVNLVKAVRSDFQTPFNVLREVSAFTKDLAGLALAVIDLPRQIIGDAKSAISDAVGNFNDAASAFGSNVPESFKNSVQSINSAKTTREGVSESYVVSGQLGLDSQTATQTDPTNILFQNPEENFELFNSVTLDQVNFGFAQQERINQDLENLRQTTVDDLIEDRNTLLELALQISNAFGAGDEDYARINGRPSPNQRIQEMSIDEFAILRSLYDTIQALDSVTSTNELDQGRTESAFQYVGSLAAESDITFNSDSTSKIRLPVPFGLNMEQIAARYLGNPDRWVEIAALNGMRSPYIDEDGFFLPLLSNADGRQFTISSRDNLFINQKVYISSLTQPTTIRRIINIEQINTSTYLITVDGLDNLSTYTTTDQAKMRAYLPGTVNSLDQIFVPNDGVAEDTVLSRPVPAFEGDPLVGLSKIDWLLEENGDVAMDSFGDARLAAGITNISQALKLKFVTPPNRLLKNPEYGAGLTPGISNADLNSQDVLRQIVKSIETDPRFGAIISLTLQRSGAVFAVSLAVQIANGNGLFPINFVVKV